MLRLLAAVATLFITVDLTAMSARAGDAGCGPGVVAAQHEQAEQIMTLASKIIGNGNTAKASKIIGSGNTASPVVEAAAVGNTAKASKIIGSGNTASPVVEKDSAVESKPIADCVDIQNKAKEIFLLAAKIVGNG
jgi:hypothetical protein